MDAIGITIEEIAQSAAAVSSSIQQQGTATQEIVFNMHKASGKLHEIVANMESVARLAQSTDGNANSILASLREVNENTETLSREVGDCLSAIRKDNPNDGAGSP